jgi:hypothetical protein
VFVPLCWLAAGVCARRGRAVAAGALLGLSAGWEVWGVLGAAVLLLGPDGGWGRVRQAGAGALALTGVVAATYLPFVLTGEFRMFELRWIVVPGSLVAVLWPDSVRTWFPWGARLAQAGCAGAASVATALALRRHRDAVWLVPLVATAVRLVLDPVLYSYYWTPVLVLALAGLAIAGPGTRAWLAVAALCLWQPWPVAHTWWGTLAVTLPLAAACALVIPRPPRLPGPRPG